MTDTVHTEFPDAPQRLLAIGVEPAGTRACLIEPAGGRYRLAGFVNLARSRDATMPMQVADTCRRLGQRLGCVLWDEELNTPFMRSIDPMRYPPLHQVALAASPRGALTVLLTGLSRSGSLAAARESLAASPSRLVGEVVFDASGDNTRLALTLNHAQPDVVVIVGGIDTDDAAAQSTLLALCRAVSQTLTRSPRTQRPHVIYAANTAAAERAEVIFRSGEGAIAPEFVDNVLPAPMVTNPAPLAHALTFHSWRMTQRIAGFKEVARWVTPPGQPTTMETTFAQMVQAWAIYKSLDTLHGLYLGPLGRLHVRSSAPHSTLEIHMADATNRAAAPAGWDAPRLISGDAQTADGLRGRFWWDRMALAPTLAALGQVAPGAVMQTLDADLLEETDV